MTKDRWQGLLKSIRNHLEPEKEEQLKWMKTEIEDKVGKILSLVKGNGDKPVGKLKKLPELIHLVEDVHQHYESLHSRYENLRVEVKNNFNGEDSSSSDSESYFSPAESNAARNSGSPNTPTEDNQNFETSDAENTILKDKLTTSSKAKDTTSLSSQVAEVLKNHTVQDAPKSTRQLLAQVEELKGEVARLKFENETLCTQKKQLEEQIEHKVNEVKQNEEKLLRQEACILELQDTFNDSGSLEVKEKGYLSRISNLISQNYNLKLQVDELSLHKHELEEQLSHETEERSSQEKAMIEQMDSLKKELLSANSQKAELEFEHEKKSTEASEYLLQNETLKEELMNQVLIEKHRVEEKERFELQVKDLDRELDSLSSEKLKLEEQIAKTSHEAYLSEAEKQELQRKISDLQASLSEHQKELLAQQRKFEACKDELNAQIRSLIEEVQKQKNTLKELYDERDTLQAELETLQNDKRQYKMELEQEKQDAKVRESQMEEINAELTNKILDQQTAMLKLEDAKGKLKSENEKAQSRISGSKINFHTVERKMEEMAQEVRKEFEDKYIILSRRIKVAEQLQMEIKEWWLRTKEMFEGKSKELKECMERSDVGLVNIKHMSITANNFLISLDRVALKFEECTANFLNRISKASCELKFIQDRAMRKNKALIHVKNELDWLLDQLDEKEAEILILREKMWRSENKARELEKTVKKKEEGMLGREEEKREAIRQLCVWIDYHRSRSDWYKKMLSDFYSGSKKAS